MNYEELLCKYNTLLTCSNYSDPAEKIRLFRLFFRGREDVFAKRWENKKGASGYSPVIIKSIV